MTRRFAGPVRGVHAFAALSASRRRGRSGAVSVRYVPAPDAGAGARLSFAVGRRSGGAVVRNRIRRRLRAAAESGSWTVPAGDYLVSAGPGASNRPFSELRMDMEQALRQAVGAEGERRGDAR